MGIRHDSEEIHSLLNESRNAPTIPNSHLFSLMSQQHILILSLITMKRPKSPHIACSLSPVAARGICSSTSAQHTLRLSPTS